MLRILTRNARAGMVLAQPVYHPRYPAHILLKPGAALDPLALSRLREYRVGVLWIRYPALDYLARYVSPHVTAEHARVTSMLADGFDAAAGRAQGGAALEFGSFAGAVGGLLQQFIDAPQAALFLQDLVGTDQPLLAHSSTVCFISLLLGLRLEGYLVDQRARLSVPRAKKIENLGVGALLHDIGMLRLPSAVLERWHRTHDLSDPEVRRHVLLGFEMVRGHVPPTAAAVVLNHHQRYDGSGFPSIPRLAGPPAPLAGKRIHIFSRIVAVAEQFDRLRHSPVARPSGAVAPAPSPRSGSPYQDEPGVPMPLPAVTALRRLYDQALVRAIDPVVYRALLAVAPAYPPGSVVRLSDGDFAVVTGWDPADPCRPTVRHLLRMDASAADDSALGPEIDLRSHPELAVVGADGHNVEADNLTADQIRRLELPVPSVLETGTISLRRIPRPTAA